VANGEGHIAQNVEPGQQRRLLKHNANIITRACHRLTVNLDPTRRWLYQSGKQLEKRGFPATRLAQHRNELMLPHPKREILEGLDRRLAGPLKRLRDVRKRDGIGHLRVPFGKTAELDLHNLVEKAALMDIGRISHIARGQPLNEFGSS
jgi:hypothetical protein